MRRYIAVSAEDRRRDYPKSFIDRAVHPRPKRETPPLRMANRKMPLIRRKPPQGRRGGEKRKSKNLVTGMRNGDGATGMTVLARNGPNPDGIVVNRADVRHRHPLRRPVYRP